MKIPKNKWLEAVGLTSGCPGLSRLVVIFAVLLTCSGRAMAASTSTTDFSKLIPVKAKPTPADPWKEYQARTLNALPEFQPGEPGPALDKYGGRTDQTWEAKGFFYPKQVEGRWWLVDPEGHPFVHVGVVSVNAGGSPAIQRALKQKFGSNEKWAEAITGDLREAGFNGTGAWSDTSALRSVKEPLVYTLIWDYMSRFGRSLKITTQRPGHAGYPNNCFPVFHPDFENFCANLSKALAATKDDPYLLGHFSDNELPYPILERYLALDPADPVMGSSAKAAHDWLDQRKGRSNVRAKEITDADREAFAGFVYDRYFAITTAAIRKADPHHLCLGSRFHSNEKRSPASFAAAGKYLDVVAVNLYYLWEPDITVLQNWEKWSGRPCLITEWYTKGDDRGSSNVPGAGWIVPTQNDRGLFYQNYTLQLLESRVCVGWHWFKYQDDDPAHVSADKSAGDSNKGMVAVDFKPYAPLLSAMTAVNSQVYRLADYFDSRQATAQRRPLAYKAAAPETGSAIEEKPKAQSIVLDPALPNVLIIGDSISMGYTPVVQQLLKGKANVVRPLSAKHTAVNCEGTTAGVRSLDQWLGATKWDVIHFNFGLHDVKRVKTPGDSTASTLISDPRQADLPTYTANLEKIVSRLQQTGAQLIFATTTPVPADVAYVPRTPSDIPEYNAAARRIMEAHQIPIDDLYGLCLPQLAQIQRPKNVHFTDEGSRQLGRQVAAKIEEQLAQRERRADKP
ncbi:MAG: SGNH/GDSL hydrolase family protein [Verrucomicrobiota bacterium]